MGAFLEAEKRYQAKFKLDSPYFSPAAGADGIYRRKVRPFCLPLAYAVENLFPAIRQSAIKFFASRRIKWHDGLNGQPSNHLCSSQVSCVNFLFPFFNQPTALADLLRPIFPTLEEMLPVEDNQFVSFEWIGNQNYLRERISGNARRTRGANFTSADAIVMFRHQDGKQHLVLIEWKYTESYGRTSLMLAKTGTDRTAIYRWLYDDVECVLRKNLIPSFQALFFEPFYQLMRQQFLAHEMEKARELGADIVSLLHVTPDQNVDFHKVTSPQLEHLGTTPIGIWSRLVQKPGRFKSVSWEQLFRGFSGNLSPEIDAWHNYFRARYPWIAS